MWIDIKDYEGIYRISDTGEVYSYYSDKIINSFINPNGYSQIELYKEGKRKKYRVHRLVAKHFLPTYSEDLVVNHINGNKLDNRAVNLECITQRDNIKHSVANGLQKTGVEAYNSVLNLSQVQEINTRLLRGERIKDIALTLNIPYYVVYDIKRGKGYYRITGRNRRGM